MKAYLITFDPLVVKVETVHSIILNHPSIEEWWHYLSGTYIVTVASNTNIVTFKKAFADKWPTKDSYLIAEVSEPTVGMLPQGAWDWLNKRLGA